MNIEKDNEWGNLSLPGLSHEELMDPNLNYVLANLARNKDPKWLARQEEIYKSPQFRKLISKLSKQKWSDPAFQAKQHIARILAWADDIDRRKKISEWASQPKSKNHKHNIGNSLKDFYSTKEGKRVREDIANKQRGIKRATIKCPHCDTVGGKGIMVRWHFDNCKHIGDKK